MCAEAHRRGAGDNFDWGRAGPVESPPNSGDVAKRRSKGHMLLSSMQMSESNLLMGGEGMY